MKKSYDQPRQHIKSRDSTLPTKVHLVKAMFFPVVMYGYESWTIKKSECWRINWCFWTVVLDKTLEDPLDFKETARRSNQSILKEIRPEYSLEFWCWSWNSNTLATWCEELTYLKRPRCWEWLKVEEKETTEDEMVGSHHQLHGHEFEQSPGVGDGHRSLACCSPWGHKESDTTEWLNWTETMDPSEWQALYWNSFLCAKREKGVRICIKVLF